MHLLDNQKIMVTLEEYKQEILAITSTDDKSIFTQKHFFHGNPFVFLNRENDYYHFRKRIADQFKISFYEVAIVSSSKFGFSPYKFTEFNYNSDIDVVLFNGNLFDSFHYLICEYQYKIRNLEITLNQKQTTQYHRFLKYFIMGWMRPDLLPQNTNNFQELKTMWDDFFNGISNSKSEVGNYIVKGGLFKDYSYAEKYYLSSIDEASRNLKSTQNG